ncbi:PAS domain S-box protein [Allohahella marinimesophila]|uniref:PAS domain S-box protein n=1 Tax=Allohahella marinimesophila TaxID=1054972 RepID=UPI0031E1869D
MGQQLAVLTAGLTLLFTLVLVHFVGGATLERARENVGAQLYELAHQTTDKLDRGMFERYREIQLLAERLSQPGVDMDPKSLQAVLDMLQETYPFYAWLGITDLEGWVLASTSGILQGADVSARPWFSNAFKGIYLSDVHDAVLLAKLLPNPTNEPKRFFDVAFPLQDASGQPRGVLGAHLSWQWAKEVEESVLRTLRARHDSEALILTNEGEVLLGPKNLMGSQLPLSSVRGARSGEGGFVSENWPDGQRYVVGYSESQGYRNYPGFGWIVLVRQLQDTAYAPVSELQRSLLTGGLMAALVFSILVLLVARRLTRPLRKIALSAKAIEAGQAKTITSVQHSSHEITTLTAALNGLLERLTHKEQQQLELNATLEHRVQQRTTELGEMVEALTESETHIRAVIDTALDAFVGVDSEGNITDWNKQAETMFGWSKAEILGAPVSSSIIPPRFREAHARGMKHFSPASESGVIGKRLQLFALRRNGEEFPVEMTIGLIESARQHSFGTFIQDISARKQAEDALARERSLLNTVLDTIEVGVVACNSAGELVLFNRAARNLHGQNAHNVPDNEWAREFRLYGADAKTLLEKDDIPLYRALKGEIVQSEEMAVKVDPDQPARFLLASARAMQTDTGEPLGAVVAMQDITVLKESARQLASNEERLRAITENIPALIAQVDRDERFTFLNSKGAALFGRAPQALLGETVAQAYGPDNYGNFAHHIATARSGKKVVFDDTIKTKESVRHFQCMYIPQLGPSGEPDGFYALAFDMTDRKMGELRLAESEERLRTITDNLPVLIAYIDRDEVHRFANATYKLWFGISPNEVIGKRVSEIMSPEAYEAGREQLHSNLAGEHVRFDTEMEVDGERRHARIVGIPDFKDGSVRGVYVMTTDITSEKVHEQQLQALAREDTLTGLPNRRAFREAFNTASLRAARSGTPLVLIILDVDYFKRINDSLGHSGGDAVLTEFARRLKASVRATDTVARFAGDEFTIILENVEPPSDATRVAEKIVVAMREPFDVLGQSTVVTTSIGIAVASGPDIDEATLVARADEALYQAKAKGRDGYWLAD